MSEGGGESQYKIHPIVCLYWVLQATKVQLLCFRILVIFLIELGITFSQICVSLGKTGIFLFLNTQLIVGTRRRLEETDKK